MKPTKNEKFPVVYVMEYLYLNGSDEIQRSKKEKQTEKD